VRGRVAGADRAQLVDVLGDAPGAVAVGDGVDRDLVEPGRKWAPGVLVPRNPPQGLHEDLRGHVLRSRLLLDSRVHESVDLVEVAVVELPERGRVLLRALYEATLVLARRQATHWPPCLFPVKRDLKVTGYVSSMGGLCSLEIGACESPTPMTPSTQDVGVAVRAIRNIWAEAPWPIIPLAA